MFMRWSAEGFLRELEKFSRRDERYFLELNDFWGVLKNLSEAWQDFPRVLNNFCSGVEFFLITKKLF